MVWRTAKSLIKLRDQINQLAPQRSKASDGTIGDASHQGRESDHNAWVKDGDVGVVTAMDITHDPAHLCDAQKIVDALIASKDPRIKYIIWNRRICSSTNTPWVWRAYSGANAHNHHFHLSVIAEKGKYDSEDVWKIA